MTHEPLKPCPFCGSTHVYVVEVFGGHRVECRTPKCPAGKTLNYGEGPDAVARRWNSRG